jgi:hypothetical protein
MMPTLRACLFPPIEPIPPENRGMPPLKYLYQELKKKGVTLQLLPNKGDVPSKTT